MLELADIKWDLHFFYLETGIPRENHWQTLSQNVVYRVHFARAGFELSVSGDRHWLHIWSRPRQPHIPA
jgi:hypothetical protein